MTTKKRSGHSHSNSTRDQQTRTPAEHRHSLKKCKNAVRLRLRPFFASYPIPSLASRAVRSPPRSVLPASRWWLALLGCHACIMAVTREMMDHPACGGCERCSSPSSLSSREPCHRDREEKKRNDGKPKKAKTLSALSPVLVLYPLSIAGASMCHALCRRANGASSRACKWTSGRRGRFQPKYMLRVVFSLPPLSLQGVFVCALHGAIVWFSRSLCLRALGTLASITPPSLPWGPCRRTVVASPSEPNCRGRKSDSGSPSESFLATPPPPDKYK